MDEQHLFTRIMFLQLGQCYKETMQQGKTLHFSYTMELQLDVNVQFSKLYFDFLIQMT